MITVGAFGSWLATGSVALSMVLTVGCSGGTVGGGGTGTGFPPNRVNDGGTPSTVSFCGAVDSWSKNCGLGGYDVQQCEQQASPFSMPQLEAATACATSPSCDKAAFDQCLQNALGPDPGPGPGPTPTPNPTACIDTGTLTANYWTRNGDNGTSITQIQFVADGSASMEISNGAGGDAWYSGSWTLNCPTLDVTFTDGADPIHFTVEGGQLSDGSSGWSSCNGKCF